MTEPADWARRYLARTTSRRSLLARVGTVFTGAAALPLLPVVRAFAAARRSAAAATATTPCARVLADPLKLRRELWPDGDAG